MSPDPRDHAHYLEFASQLASPVKQARRETPPPPQTLWRGLTIGDADLNTGSAESVDAGSGVGLGCGQQSGLVALRMGLTNQPALALDERVGMIRASQSRWVVATAVMALAAGGLAFASSPASAGSKSNKPAVVTVDAVPDGQSVTVTYTINRANKAVASQTCTLDGDVDAV